ncbi:ribonuclease HII [bacterium]|nr:ribonuclease HII [bacterium]
MRFEQQHHRPEKYYALEEYFQTMNFSHITGVDEAGRGALAGPVVAAAVCFKQKPLELLYDIKDSKKIAERKREALFDTLIALPYIDYAVGIVDASSIDTMNILQASLYAMQIAVSNLKQQADLCLVDGHIPFKSDIKQYTLTKGDDRCISIGAASIIAKVTRDRMMRQYHEEYPLYDFIKHKGYATTVHKQAIVEHGMSPLHRKSFQLKR